MPNSLPMKKEIIKLPIEPWCPKGFAIESNEPMESFDLNKLSVHLEPEQMDGYMKNETIIERMKGKGLNSNVLKYLLDNPKLIPDNWKKYYGVYFDATVLLRPVGDRDSLCLYWDGGKWDWSYDWLDNGRGASRPSAVLEQVSTQNSETENSSGTLDLDLAIERVKKEGYVIYKTI